MNKVININFQGRILPIEEMAYEMLKQYIESLRNYFQNEELLFFKSKKWTIDHSSKKKN